MTIDVTAEAILIAHQRHDHRSCLCGWAELGMSHPGHQVAVLHEAGLLNESSFGSRQLTPITRTAMPKRLRDAAGYCTQCGTPPSNEHIDTCPALAEETDP